MQYSLKVYLLFHGAMSNSVLFAERKKTPWEMGLVQRLEAAASGLSTTRYSSLATAAMNDALISDLCA